jgi:hypothetical protein
MPLEDTILYEQFAAARLIAVELTDAYRETSADDPRRAVLWEGVVRQTELARGLLESWLALSPAAAVAQVPAATLCR